MTTEQLNEHYAIVGLWWKPNKYGLQFFRQPGIFHTIQDALNEITKISHFNNFGGIYQITTSHTKYELIDLFQMKLKQV